MSTFLSLYLFWLRIQQTPYNCLPKNATFSIKTTREYITSYIIKQTIYCSFEQHNLFFCTILQQFTTRLKMPFQVFSFTSKMVQEFSIDRNILMLLLSVLFYLQTVSQFFQILVFSQDIWRNIHFAPEVNLIS